MCADVKYGWNKQAEWLLLDQKGIQLAHVLLESSLDEEILTFRLEDGSQKDLMDFMDLGEVSVVNPDKGINLSCTPLRQTPNRIIVKRNSIAYFELRRDLRVPVQFESYIYPLSGMWKGRQEIRSVDISCGGIGFSSPTALTDGEQLEVVLPVTSYPLVVQCQVLHHRKLDDEMTFYAAKFIEMRGDEEAMIRKAVFNIQLQNRRKGL